LNPPALGFFVGFWDGGPNFRGVGGRGVVFRPPFFVFADKRGFPVKFVFPTGFNKSVFAFCFWGGVGCLPVFLWFPFVVVGG